MVEYQLKVVSPDGEVFNDKVISISLRGADGDLAVFAGHVPFITTIRPGRCVVTLPDESELEGTLTNGILKVSRELVTLLVGDINQLSFLNKNS